MPGRLVFILFRTILYLFLAAFLFRLVIGFLRPRPISAPRRPPPLAGPERLVEDPVCGVRLPESHALAAGGEFFCSRECASKRTA